MAEAMVGGLVSREEKWRQGFPKREARPTLKKED